MSRAEVAEIRRTSKIKKRGLLDRRRRDLREAKAHYKAKGFSIGEYRAEVEDIWDHFRKEMELENQYVKEQIAAARRRPKENVSFW